MNARLTQVMSLSALGWLGQAFESPSVLSPFHTVTPEGFDEVAHTQLLEGGVIDEQGQITPQWLVPLKKLAEADAFGRVRLLAGDRRAERLTYFTGSDRETVAVTVAPGNVRVEFLPEIEDFLSEMKEYVGDSMLTNAAVSLELPFEQAVILGALLDRNRQAVLRSFAEEDELRFPGLSAAEITAVVEEANQPPQRLTGMIKSLPGRDLPVPMTGIKQHVQAMSAAGILRDEGEFYHLSDGLRVLAASCLVFDHMVHLDAGRLTSEGRLEMHEALCLQAGLHDLLKIDPGGDTVALETVSSNTLLRYIKEILTEVPVVE